MFSCPPLELSGSKLKIVGIILKTIKIMIVGDLYARAARHRHFATMNLVVEFIILLSIC